MSSVLYYSKYCDNCKLLLYELGKSNLQNDIHFLSIDRRIEKKGKIYIVLDNGREILLPNQITSVPSLLLLHKGNKILVGNDVLNYFKPKISSEKVMATQNNVEPMAFSFTEMGTSMSDSYSYWDQTSDELSAKGQGGLRQMHSFVTLNHNDKIYTPEDDYEPDKVGEIDLGKLQTQREKILKLLPKVAWLNIIF